MSNFSYIDDNLTKIANFIRASSGGTDAIARSQMGEKIRDLLSLYSTESLTATPQEALISEAATYLQYNVSTLSDCFVGEEGLIEAYFPITAAVQGDDFFTNCTSIYRVTFDSLETIQSRYFFRNSSLQELVLNSSSVVAVVNTASVGVSLLNVLESEKLKIYVPSNLIEEYKIATNWSLLADHFYPLEDLTNIVTGGI